MHIVHVLKKLSANGCLKAIETILNDMRNYLHYFRISFKIALYTTKDYLQNLQLMYEVFPQENYEMLLCSKGKYNL